MTEPVVAIVTGAARGIGAATVEALRVDGLVVAAVDLDREGLSRHESDSGVRCVAADMSDATEVARVVAVAEEMGRPLVGVANAGIQRDGRLAHLSDDQWRDVLAVDLTAGFLLSRALWSHMAEARFGRLVFLSSVAKDGNFGQANYAAAKAGLVGLARTAAIEGGPSGITANVICPGVIDTPGTAQFKARAPGAFERFVERIPARRVGSPEEVAGVIAFLCGDSAAYVSGQVIYVDGGLSSGHT